MLPGGDGSEQRSEFPSLSEMSLADYMDVRAAFPGEQAEKGGVTELQVRLAAGGT